MMKPELDSCQNLVTDDKNHHWLKDIGQLECTVLRAIHFIATDDKFSFTHVSNYT